MCPPPSTADFNYNTSTASLQPGQPALNLPGNVHQGFAAIATSLWPGVQAALQELVASPAGVSNVYVAGHSLGAGVATLLSYGMQVIAHMHESCLFERLQWPLECNAWETCF